MAGGNSHKKRKSFRLSSDSTVYDSYRGWVKIRNPPKMRKRLHIIPRRMGIKIGKPNINKRVLLATMLLLSPLMLGNVYGLFLSSPENNTYVKKFRVDPSWVVDKTLVIHINIHDAVDVYGWQANVLYDPNKLVLLNVTPGSFLAENSIVIDSVSGEISGETDVYIGDAMLAYATDIRSDMVFIFGCRFGDLPGKDGTGKVATLTFGVWSHVHEPFYIDLGNPILVNKNAEMINEGLLAIEWD